MNRKYVEELIKLTQENPELEVLCKVDSDIVAEDGYVWWLGRINDRWGIEIDEYTCIQERIVFKSEEEWTEWFEDLFDVDDYVDIPDSEWEEFCEKKVNEEVTWTKAIFVSVTTL